MDPRRYDPETKLYIFGTGNPTPAYTTGTRGDGDNLFTCALVAVNVDTGKMAWYFQTSPHDMHDYDSAQTPVLVDGMFNGKMRKLVLTAARNGYLLYAGSRDRRTPGDQQVRHCYTNWANGLNKFGGPQHDPTKTPRSPARWSPRIPTARSTGSRPPSRRIRVCSTSPEGNALLALLSDRPRPARIDGPWRQGRSQRRLGGSFLTAIDYKTGKAAWRHPYYGNGGGGGLLTTAGGLLFAGDGAGNLVAHDAANGKPLVEHAHRRSHECAADIHTGRPPIHDRRDGRHAVVIHAVLTRDILFTVQNRRDFVDLIVRAAALPGAAEFFSVWAHAANQHDHSSSAAPPEPPLLRDYKPKFFAPDDFAALRAFTEILIPTDDTPVRAKRIARTTSISFCRRPIAPQIAKAVARRDVRH